MPNLHHFPVEIHTFTLDQAHSLALAWVGSRDHFAMSYRPAATQPASSVPYPSYGIIER